MTRLSIAAAILLAALSCTSPIVPPPGAYIFVWAGDSAEKASDFLFTVDANSGSESYGKILASVPTGVVGSHPHHTEAVMPANGHLLANGFHAGRTWLFDLNEPLAPKVLTTFDGVAGFSFPHTFVRMSDTTVLATFQRKSVAGGTKPMAGMPMAGAYETGGLVLMDERGTAIRSGAAADASIPDKRIFPYSVVPFAGIDRALSTTTNMDRDDTIATAQWVQLWRLSDLTLLKTFALPKGPRGDEQLHSGEPFALPDGKSALVHTFNCGLYLLRGLDGDAPSATFVHGFEGEDCGVPVLTGRWFIQTVPAAHALVSLDVSDPEHPKEVGRVSFGQDEQPHWLSIGPVARRLVANSASTDGGNRLYVINLDPASGGLSIDARFRDPGSTRPGVHVAAREWPHGWTGTAAPHGAVFSR